MILIFFVFFTKTFSRMPNTISLSDSIKVYMIHVLLILTLVYAIMCPILVWKSYEESSLRLASFVVLCVSSILPMLNVIVACIMEGRTDSGGWVSSSATCYIIPILSLLRCILTAGLHIAATVFSSYLYYGKDGHEDDKVYWTLSFTLVIIECSLAGLGIIMQYSILYPQYHKEIFGKHGYTQL